MTDSCLICGLSPISTKIKDRKSMMYIVTCKRCGKYLAHRFLLEAKKLYLGENTHQLSGLARERYERKLEPLVIPKNIEDLYADPLIPHDDDIEAKSQKILAYLKRKSDRYGHGVRVYAEEDMSIAYAIEIGEFISLLMLLYDSGYISFPSNVKSENVKYIMTTR